MNYHYEKQYKEWNADNTEDKDKYMNYRTQRVEESVFCTPYKRDGKQHERKLKRQSNIFMFLTAV